MVLQISVALIEDALEFSKDLLVAPRTKATSKVLRRWRNVDNLVLEFEGPQTISWMIFR